MYTPPAVQLQNTQRPFVSQSSPRQVRLSAVGPNKSPEMEYRRWSEAAPRVLSEFWPAAIAPSFGRRHPVKPRSSYDALHFYSPSSDDAFLFTLVL